MKEPYTSHVSCLKKMCFGLMPRHLRVFKDCTDSFLLAFVQVAFLQEVILLYKLQYFSIYIVNLC
jgi:hypothetical protein